MRAFSLLGIIGILGLMSSCSKDDFDSEVLSTSSFEVVSYMPNYEENILQTRAGGYEAMTRAWSIPDGYVAYDSGDQIIGVCFTKNGDDPVENKTIGQLFKSSGKWRANVELAEGNYFLYGYIPHVPAIKCSITDRDGTNANYSTGAILTLQDVPTVMSGDFCVVIGAKDGTDKNTDNGLRKGDFAYSAKAIDGDSEDAGKNNFVFLLFDHLYSALSVNLKVHGDYNALRTIKLKSLRLSTKEGTTVSKDKTNITISLKATEGSDPIDNIEYGVSSAGVENKNGIEFWSSASGEELSTDYQPFIGHFMPTGITTLVLTSTYDVYDKNGNLVRENCKATNTMVLNDMLRDHPKARRGNRYKIEMTIQPTYLYVMSDEDLDNPTMVIN